MGKDGVETMAKVVAENMDGFLTSAETLYDNFMSVVRG